MSRPSPALLGLLTLALRPPSFGPGRPSPRRAPLRPCASAKLPLCSRWRCPGPLRRSLASWLQPYGLPASALVAPLRAGPADAPRGGLAISVPSVAMSRPSPALPCLVASALRPPCFGLGRSPAPGPADATHWGLASPVLSLAMSRPSSALLGFLASAIRPPGSGLGRSSPRRAVLMPRTGARPLWCPWRLCDCVLLRPSVSLLLPNTLPVSAYGALLCAGPR